MWLDKLLQISWYAYPNETTWQVLKKKTDSGHLEIMKRISKRFKALKRLKRLIVLFRLKKTVEDAWAMVNTRKGIMRTATTLNSFITNKALALKGMVTPTYITGKEFRNMTYGYLWWIIDSKKNIYVAIGKVEM